MPTYSTPMELRERNRFDRVRVGRLNWREFDVLDLAALLAPHPLTPSIVAERVCRTTKPDTGYQVLRRMERADVGLLTSSRANPGARPNGVLSGAERHWRPSALGRALYAEALHLIDDRNETRTA